MRILVAVAVAGLAGCSANPQKEVARKAAKAMAGSPETLTAVVSLTMEGTGSLEESLVVFTRSISFRRERMREDVIRTGLPALVTAVDGNVAYRLDRDGRPVWESEAEAADRRARIYHHPIGFLLAAFSGNTHLSENRAEGAEEAVDLTAGGDTYSLYVDSQTHLPTRVVSQRSGGVRETSFSRYQTVHGYTLPYHIVEKSDGQVVAEWSVERQFAGWDIPGLAAPAR